MGYSIDISGCLGFLRPFCPTNIKTCYFFMNFKGSSTSEGKTVGFDAETVAEKCRFFAQISRFSQHFDWG